MNNHMSAEHKPLINFLRGWPNASLLPSELLREAADTVLSNHALAGPAMSYGPDEGDKRLRQELGKWFSDYYSDHIKEPVGEERITITGGASQNLACLLQTFSDPEYTRNVWIVVPTYFLAFRIFNDAGLGKKLRALPEDDEGLDIDFFRQEIAKSEREAEQAGNNEPEFKVPNAWGRIYKHIIYCVPTFSNPSSKTMSLERRQQLVRLAREYDALIITDDVYDQLQWYTDRTDPDDIDEPFLPMTKAEIPRIVDVDRYLDGGPPPDSFGNVASNGSFSKIVGPGVRTGWCESTSKLAYGLSQTGSSRSGGAPSHLVATFLAEALANGRIQHHIYETLQPAYAKRWKTMMDAINEDLIPLGVQLPQEHRNIVGGYFIWLRLPPHIRAGLLTRRAKDTCNLVVADGKLFEVPGDAKSDATNFPYDIRLCFAWEEEDRLREGVKRLAGGRGGGGVVRDMLEEPEGLNTHVKRKSFGEGEGSVDLGAFG